MELDAEQALNTVDQRRCLISVNEGRLRLSTCGELDGVAGAGQRGALYAVARSARFAERNVNLTLWAGPPAQMYGAATGRLRELNQLVMRLTWDGSVILREMPGLGWLVREMRPGARMSISVTPLGTQAVSPAPVERSPSTNPVASAARSRAPASRNRRWRARRFASRISGSSANGQRGTCTVIALVSLAPE